MPTFIELFPWYFWVAWGILGIPYILNWVIKSTKDDPVMWRVGWSLTTVLGVLVIIDNLINGTGVLIEYLSIVNGLSIPMVVITCTLISIGGYQKSLRPDFDPEKRRMAIICMYGLVVTVICLGLVFGGFYIYDNFFKR